MHFDNFTLATIQRMATLHEVMLTDRHMEILSFVYSYYNTNKVGPALYILKKRLQLSKKELGSLFPQALLSVYSWLNIPIHSVDKSCTDFVDIAVSCPRQVYLDNNATTPIRQEVADLLVKYYSGELGFANPSSSTEPGKKAYDLVIQAKEAFAAIWGVDTEELFFTGSCTEANNMFLQGIAFAHLQEKGHFIVSSIEHSSILKTVTFLESLGFSATLLPVNSDGIVQISTLEETLKDCERKGLKVLATSIMLVNNEIGTIQPVEKAAAICSRYNVPLHSDCTQGFGKLRFNPREMGVTALSCAAHKINGPKGIGLLYLDKDFVLPPLIHGGGQEFGLRGGTENPGHILGFALAAKLAEKERVSENKRMSGLQQYLLKGLRSIEPDINIIGSLNKRVAMNLSVGFPNVNSRSLLLGLNKIGIYVSTGSACASGEITASTVVDALGVDSKKYAVIRFSLGHQTDKEDLDYLLEYLPELLDNTRGV